MAEHRYEPTAAVVAYHLDKKPKATILVLDLGGNAFNVSLLEAEGVNPEEVVAVGACILAGQLKSTGWLAADQNGGLVRVSAAVFSDGPGQVSGRSRWTGRLGAALRGSGDRWPLPDPEVGLELPDQVKPGLVRAVDLRPGRLVPRLPQQRMGRADQLLQIAGALPISGSARSSTTVVALSRAASSEVPPPDEAWA
jgi:hypothetical protein